QAIVWWAGSYDSRNSPLSRLLFARDADGNVGSDGAFTPDDAAAIRRFEAVAADAPGCVSVERSALAMPTSWRPALALPTQLAAAAFTRTLDQRWRRTSYSDISAGSYDAIVASEAEEPSITDEPVVAVPSPVAPADGGALGCPLAEMGAGAEVGTVVHRALAASDFDAADLDSELERRLAAAQGRRAVDVGDPDVVVGGLRAAIETPLGPLLEGLRLRDVQRADRLDELEFELPLAGGDQPNGWLTLSMISRVLRDHLSPDDPLGGYAERLGDPVLRQNVRGYLTGSLDLVVRTGTPGAPRFAVLDYKTNWLGGAGEELTVHHYRPDALAVEMYRHHY